MNSTSKVAKVGVFLFRPRVIRAAMIALFATTGYLSVCQVVVAQVGSDGFMPANCPPEAFSVPRNCKDVERVAYALAIRKKGYLNANGNNIPDVMERPYVINRNDCSTGNAHAACMFNDPCTAPFGKLMGLRSNSARHATTMYVGNNGMKFECDFTPDSSGIMIAHRPDTRIGPAFPDPGESMDPAYNCTMNGANTQPLNAFGGGGGGGGGGMQSAIMALLMQMLQQQFAKLTPSPVPTGVNAGLGTPTPTPQPTPTLTPIAVTANQGGTTRSLKSLDAMDMPSDDKLLGNEDELAEDRSLDSPDEQDLDSSASQAELGSSRSAWDRNSADIFGSIFGSGNS